MKLSYFDTAGFAVTVCDREGVVLYQNAKAVLRDGDVLGRNLFDCHKESSARMIRRMIAEGSGHTYETTHSSPAERTAVASADAAGASAGAGTAAGASAACSRSFIHQTPWYAADGSVAGLIEIDIDLPAEVPVYSRK